MSIGASPRFLPTILSSLPGLITATFVPVGPAGAALFTYLATDDLFTFQPSLPVSAPAGMTNEPPALPLAYLTSNTASIVATSVPVPFVMPAVLSFATKTTFAREAKVVLSTMISFLPVTPMSAALAVPAPTIIPRTTASATRFFTCSSSPMERHETRHAGNYRPLSRLVSRTYAPRQAGFCAIRGRRAGCGPCHRARSREEGRARPPPYGSGGTTIAPSRREAPRRGWLHVPVTDPS